MTASDYFEPGDARRVNNGHGVVALVVGNQSDGVPTPVLLRCAGVEGVLRFAGGTAVQDPANKAAMLTFAQNVFGDGQLKQIALMSGGTRIVDENFEVDPMMVELPGLIWRWNPQCVTLGSVPRTTATMSYQGEHSSFMLSDRLDASAIPNPDIHLLWVIQHSASQVLDWDGDLELYFEFMQLLRETTEAAPAMMVWNGGGVTAKEIRGALERQIPVLLIEGSGRFPDDAIRFYKGQAVQDPRNLEILQTWQAEGVSPDFVTAGLDDHEFVRTWLTEHGLRRA